ncbi:FG-GAP repeat domain-containing protein [Candidatus Riflebacteria bacterium]
MSLKTIYKKPGLLIFFFSFAFLLSGSGQDGNSTNSSPEFSASLSGDIYAQVQVIGDVDGDGKKDLVFGATDGKVHLFSSQGNEITAGLWPKFTGGPITAAVTVSDIDGDGHAMEVLTAGYDHKLYALDRYGREIWKFDAGGAIHLSQPRVETVDKESGKSMILLGSHAKKVFSLDFKGRLNWAVRADGTFSTTVESSDLDGDGKKEIIAKDDNGKIHVLNYNGSKISGWPKSTIRNGHWPYEVGITDLDGDGQKEILATDPNRQLLIWNRKGKLVRSMGLTGQAHSAPRVADVDADGKPDFIYGDQKGNINVLDNEGKSLKGFPYTLEKGNYIYGTPQFADVDGDGKMDIIYTAFDPNGKGKQAGYVHAISAKGKKVSGFPKYIGRTIAPVTIADLDGDGFIEIIAAGGIGYTDKQLHVFRTKGKIPIKMAIMGSEIQYF